MAELFREHLCKFYIELSQSIAVVCRLSLVIGHFKNTQIIEQFTSQN